MRARQVAVIGVAVLSALVLSLSPGHAKEKQKPDATIKFSGGSVAAGIGYSWGEGTLTYKGKEHPLEVSGLTVADVGVSKVEASGKVYGLHKLEDINGNFTAVQAGGTVGGGGGAATMRNQNGVTIHVVATTKGIKFTLGASGVSIKLK